MDFKLDRVQIALFLSSIDKASRLNEIASIVAENIQELSGVDPMIMPLPDNAPPEFPQIQLGNEHTGWGFQLAPSRCDFFYAPLSHQTFSETLSEMQEKISGVWQVFAEKFAARGHRLGVVTNFSYETENAAEKLRQQYFNPKFGKGAKEAQLHYLHTSVKADLNLNQWVRLLSQPERPGQHEKILMVIDINTIPDTPLEQMDVTVVNRFLQAANQLVEDTLGFHSEDI